LKWLRAITVAEYHLESRILTNYTITDSQSKASNGFDQAGLSASIIKYEARLAITHLTDNSLILLQ